MGETLVLVDADELVAEMLAAPLRARGWNVIICSPDEDAVFERIIAAVPAAVVFDLESAQEAQCDLAASAAADERLPRPMVLFLGGDEEQRALAREVVSSALFVTAEELLWVLKRVVTPVY